MATCFVIQRFDAGGEFDKRYEDVFVPAIRAAGLEPYRVDRDPKATVLIESIEQGIRDAAACLADITEDNPNIWYELGFASAAAKDIVLVCSKERTKFPFDVQHRNIVTYAPESPRDFDVLKAKITERLEASLAKSSRLETFAASPLREAEGLAPHEAACLAVVLENELLSGGFVWPNAIHRDMERAGFTALAASLSVRSLVKKGLLQEDRGRDLNGEPYVSYAVTDTGEDWLIANQDKLRLRATKRKGDVVTAEPGRSPEDIPF